MKNPGIRRHSSRIEKNMLCSKQPGPKPSIPAAAGLILAGGMGRRFGCPKAFALLPDGRTFLQACVDSMLQGGLGPIVATLPPDAAGEVPPQARALHLPQPDLDMFASIRLGLQHQLEYRDWQTVIILPVDHPLVRPETIMTLKEQTFPAVIPTFKEKHGHPIMITRPVAQAVAEGSHPGPTLREVLKAAPAHDVPVDDFGIRANCNTPATLRQAWDTLNA